MSGERMRISVYRDGDWIDWPSPRGWTLTLGINSPPKLTSPVGRRMPPPWAVFYDDRMVANSADYAHSAALSSLSGTGNKE